MKAQTTCCEIGIDCLKHIKLCLEHVLTEFVLHSFFCDDCCLNPRRIVSLDEEDMKVSRMQIWRQTLTSD